MFYWSFLRHVYPIDEEEKKWRRSGLLYDVIASSFFGYSHSFVHIQLVCLFTGVCILIYTRFISRKDVMKWLIFWRIWQNNRFFFWLNNSLSSLTIDQIKLMRLYFLAAIKKSIFTCSCLKTRLQKYKEQIRNARKSHF